MGPKVHKSVTKGQSLLPEAARTKSQVQLPEPGRASSSHRLSTECDGAPSTAIGAQNLTGTGTSKKEAKLDDKVIIKVLTNLITSANPKV